MPEPMTDERLAEIRADQDAMELAEVVDLLAEVERLRAELAAAHTEFGRRVAPVEMVALKRQRDEAQAEVKQWRATFGESALRDSLARLARTEAERDRLAEQVKRVREAHRPWRIYGECGHRHEKADTVLGVQDVRDVGLVCKDGYDYTVCRACCCDADGNQTLECVENHSRECHPCPVLRLLDGEPTP